MKIEINLPTFRRSDMNVGGRGIKMLTSQILNRNLNILQPFNFCAKGVTMTWIHKMFQMFVFCRICVEYVLCTLYLSRDIPMMVVTLRMMVKKAMNWLRVQAKYPWVHMPSLMKKKLGILLMIIRRLDRERLTTSTLLDRLILLLPSNQIGRLPISLIYGYTQNNVDDSNISNDRNNPHNGKEDGPNQVGKSHVLVAF